MRLAFACLALVLFLGASGGAAADETTPCPPDQKQPTLSVVEPGGSGVPYATHLLRANLKWSESGSSADPRSFTAPGARIFTEDDANSPMLVSDTPGPLTVTAVVVIRDPNRYPLSDDYSCTTSVATTVELQRTNPSVFGNFKRPRSFIANGQKLWSPQPNFSFTVKLAKSAQDRSPFTVRARGWGRLKVPGPGVRAASHDYFFRDFELEGLPESRCELLCSPTTSRGFATRLAVRAETLDFRPGGIKVDVVPPVGVPFVSGGRERFRPTPYGVDVEVFQSGERIARLRVAARCDSLGQSARCRFKTVDTRH